jgi:5-methylcytosine-specific restriction enzyme A
MTHDPYAVTPRKPLTAKQKLKLFVEHQGICCVCGLKIDGVKEAWDEHVNPLWRGGTNEWKNRAVAHVKCARAKTSEESPERSKGERVSEFHFGAKTRGTWGTGRNTKWKRKMNGETVRR